MGAHESSHSFLDEAMQVQSGHLSDFWAFHLPIASHVRAFPPSSMFISKRFFDLTLIGLFAPVWLPLMLLIALLIKLDSRGPVFFRQPRTGLNGRVFSIYKFRTMHHHPYEAANLKQSQACDDRHTRAGRLLRRTSLDELPQLLNVLANDMSLIGPRPHARYHDIFFLRYANGYADRFCVRPGLTGWAQVHGQRGFVHTQQALQVRTDYDNEYIRRWSVWMDLSILLKTLRVVVKATNAH